MKSSLATRIIQAEEKLRGLRAIRRFVHIYSNIPPVYDGYRGGESLLQAENEEEKQALEEALLARTYTMACEELGLLPGTTRPRNAKREDTTT